MDSQKFWARLQSVGRASILSHFTKALLFCIKLGMQLIWNQNTTCLQVNHRTGHGVVFCCLVTAFLGLVGWFFRLAPSFSPSTSFPFVELLTHLAIKFMADEVINVLQAPLLKKHPAKLTLTSFPCFFRLIQFLAIAAFVETDINRWKIQSGEELFTILYAVTTSISILFIRI